MSASLVGSEMCIRDSSRSSLLICLPAALLKFFIMSPSLDAKVARASLDAKVARASSSSTSWKREIA
eukprot:9127556-Alexandrium_andersonii.AAC.1